jgi:hypothetical protein
MGSEKPMDLQSSVHFPSNMSLLSATANSFKRFPVPVLVKDGKPTNESANFVENSNIKQTSVSAKWTWP